jgi:hypothetical protein
MRKRVPWFVRQLQFVLALLIAASGLAVSAPPTLAAPLADDDDDVCVAGYAVWADNRSDARAVDWSGSNNLVVGVVSSNSGVTISGSNNELDGDLEYVTSLTISGSDNSLPTAAQVAAGEPPQRYRLADYQPGGRAALEAGEDYTLVSGDLEVSGGELEGLYYVTGDAKLSGGEISGRYTIVAEGTIEVSGSEVRGTAFSDDLLFFAAEEAVGDPVLKLSGSDGVYRGAAYVPDGMIELSGSSLTVFGSLIGDTVRLNGSDLDLLCGSAGDDDEDDNDDEPPAVIVIPPPTVVIEVVNNISFVVLNFEIRNNGGRAGDVFLVLDLDDLLELSDLTFLEGVGYVRSLGNGQVVIGIGENNRINRNGVVRFRITFQVESDGSSEVRCTLRYQVRYSDSDDDDDDQEPVEITIRVPPVVVVVTPPPPVVVVIPRLTIAEIDVRFRVRWNEGGLRLYGLPLSRAITLRSGIIVQYFERARFEYHPENEGTAYVILLGRLGVELGYSQPPAAPPTNADDLEWYFPATGHVIGSRFRDYWEDEGGLATFGYPIGVAFVDERGLTVQYFERVRLEYHPEFAGTENVILLGLLGEELLLRQGGEIDDDD